MVSSIGMSAAKFGRYDPLRVSLITLILLGSTACDGDVPSLDSGGGSGQADGTDAAGETVASDGATEGSESSASGAASESGTSGTTGTTTSGGEGGTTGGDCNGECGTPGCGDCPPSDPMPVPDQDFSIDNTEISNGAYLAFLATSPSLASQSDYCSWNQSFEPISQWPPDQERLEYPVVYVNWCQAEAYCHWAGGRMCGRIGGGVNPTNQHAQADKSEWMNACSANGTQEYPYGPVYEPLACNGEDFMESAALPVNQPATCQGSLPGLYNMSGNVYEWTNECDVGQNEDDLCRRRGGSYWSEPSLMRCAMGSSRPRDHVDDYTGIRCCYD